MIEQTQSQPHSEWQSPLGRPQQSERQSAGYRVEYGVGEMPDSLEVQHLLEIEPENTLLVSAGRLLFFGGSIESTDAMTVKLAMPVFGGEPGTRTIRPVSVQRITEDGRTIAFAIDAEKARNYIVSTQNRAVA